MSDFLNALPWRLAALAGLIAGALGAIGGVDVWAGLVRCGVAFAVFFCFGMLAKCLLMAVQPAADRKAPHAAPMGASASEKGDRVA